MEAKLVLVVEDNPDDRAIYGDLLWYNGFDVMFAENAEQGYWLAREGGPDVVVLDLGLPDIDGLELCRRLKSEAPTAEIPVLALSARPETEFGAEASRSGCSFYMEKPTQPLEVLRQVERLIGPAPGGGAPVPGRAPGSWSVQTAASPVPQSTTGPGTAGPTWRVRLPGAEPAAESAPGEALTAEPPTPAGLAQPPLPPA